MEISKEFVLKKDNEDVYQYSLSNDNGIQFKILTLGGIITDILVPDRNGLIENVVVKWENYSDYLEDCAYTGAIIGRNSGRIADGEVIISRKVISLIKNNGDNTLHGGSQGFNKKNWKASVEEKENNVSLTLEYFSKDGEENFPGNLNVKVKYSLNNENELLIEYEGVSDRDTILNMTNHSYFNLSGNMKRSILGQLLTIKSDRFAEIREDSAPTGKLINVENTPFDFREGKTIGKEIICNNEQLKRANGYDHPWVLNKNEDKYNVKLQDIESGRILEVTTNNEAVVIYTTNFPADKVLSSGGKLKKNYAVCLETQSLPIGEENEFVEDSILEAGKIYYKKTKYKFYSE